jgi:hypothetical protein
MTGCIQIASWAVRMPDILMIVAAKYLPLYLSESEFCMSGKHGKTKNPIELPDQDPNYLHERVYAA